MRGGDLSYFLLWVLGILGLLACVAVTWWGLFGDRARGRRRCPRCWYDLSGTTGLTCAECGHMAKRERSLHRTRRRPLSALAAALIAAIGATWAIQHAQLRGWMSLLPTRAILLGLPFVGETHQGMTTELARRIGQRGLSDAQWGSLIHRCVAGDRWAPPASERWERKYGDLLQRCRGLVPEGFDLDAVLAALPARIEIEALPTWPLDAPLCVQVGLHEWWPAGTECRLHVTPAWDGAQPVTLLRTPPDGRPATHPLVIETRPPRGPLEFGVRLERKLPGEGSAWDVVQQETFRLPVEFAGMVSEVIEPVRDKSLDEAVRSTFSQGVVKWSGGYSPVRVRFDPRRTFGLDPGTGIGASVELLHDDTLARRLDMWWRVDRNRDGWGMGWLVAYEDIELLAGANAADGRWRLRVRSDPALALRAGEVVRCWEGEFTVPLRVEERTDDAPPKTWRVE